MNTSIVELKDLLNDNQVTSINPGIIIINEYFNGFEYHELKDEWTKMTKKEKQSFVKLILETSDEQTDEQTESDIDDGLVEVPDEQTEQTEPTELQQLIQSELNDLNIRKEELMNELNEINSRIFELTGESSSTESKMSKAIRVYELNKGLSRKDMLIKFQTECGLTKSGSSTYYYTITKSTK